VATFRSWQLPARTTVLGAALSLVLLRRPRRVALPLGATGFWLALMLVGLALAADDWFSSAAPREFDPDGLRGLAFQAMLALAAGGIVARAGASRPRLAWLCAGIALLIPTFTEFALRPLEHNLLPLLTTLPEATMTHVTDGIWIAWVVLALWRGLAWIDPGRGRVRHLAVAVCATALLIGPRYWVDAGHLIASQSEESDESEDEQTQPDQRFDSEAVMRGQDQLLDEALAQLSPQRPDQVDLYLVSFGGDGSEEVFRNEVEYVDRLYRERFDAAGRTLVLLNNPGTTSRFPLATVGNLQRALAAIGHIADPEQDIVQVFITSHGSPQHEIYVNLPPLPLAQVTPQNLRAALDQCGIRHRVVVLSACYAGGFIPALRDPSTMVLAAARADRASFGCGTESDITDFGRALFVDGLNRTTSLTDAFLLAQSEISGWESAQREQHSFPQLSSSREIETQLARWQATVRLGLPVPFRPAQDEVSPLR
jgi:hypothetical protein